MLQPHRADKELQFPVGRVAMVAWGRQERLDFNLRLSQPQETPTLVQRKSGS